jgi:parallel beta-helix repeat protein
MNRKGTAIWLSFVLVFSFIIIIVEIAPVVEAPTIWYVDDVAGGGGPGDPPEDFTSIQDAINASSDGDTVFVYNGTYYENVGVGKTINLTGENRDATIIDGGGKGDVVSLGGIMVNISGFTIRNSGNKTDLYIDYDAGIDMAGYNCKVFNNNIYSYNNMGILLGWSWNTITDNNISQNPRGGIHMGPILFISHNNTISNNTFFNNSGGVNGEECPKNIVKDNVFLNNDYHDISLVYSRDWVLDGNTIKGYSNASGIFLHDSVNNTIRNNTVLHHNAGIHLEFYSSGNNIIGNNFSNGYEGIYVGTYSPGNNITDNNVYSNTFCGISLNRWCGWSNVTGNIIAMNYNFSLVLIDDANENKIIGNTISSNRYGMWVDMADGNNITGNYIYSNTEYGIYLTFDSLNNRIYHNDFINNNNSSSPQVVDDSNNGNFWDNGYPSGGNYWSDFDEPREGAYDDYKGPDQNIPGSDDIVDNGTVGGGGKNPYVIGANSRDNYPIMGPFSKCMILKQGWNLISIPLTQNEQTLNKVLDPISGLYSAVQWYDNADPNDLWKHHKVGKPFGNDLKKLNETMGFWVYITPPGDTIFLYNGSYPTSNQTITLHPGWNLVGYPSVGSYNRTKGLNNLTFGQEVDSILTYNAASQKWEVIGSSDHFKIGRGYWIHAKITCVWEVPL